MGFWFLVAYQLFHLLGGGVIKIGFFFPAYSPLICFKYKNNLADTRVDVSLGCCESLIKKLLSVLSVSQWLGFKAGWFLEAGCGRVYFTTRVKFTLFTCVPQSWRQQVNGSTGKYNTKEKQEKTMQKKKKSVLRDRNTSRSKVAYQSNSTFWWQDSLWATVLFNGKIHLSGHLKMMSVPQSLAEFANQRK